MSFVYPCTVWPSTRISKSSGSAPLMVANSNTIWPKTARVSTSGAE